MKYSNTVEYNISTKLDSSGLTQLQTQIKQIELNMQRMANRDLLPKGRVEEAKAQLEGLSSALTKSFDPSLGMLNLAQFRSELQQSKVTAEGLKSAFSMTGSQGAEAFGNLAKQIGNFNNGIERSSSSLDKMFTTFSNTFRWGLVSSFFSQFMNAIHSSVDYVKELDDSLTQIMLVTDYNRDSMNEYAKSANEAAKALSMSTTGMTNASLVFAQQGYNLNQSQELATLSAKVANASQQDTATTSDQITAYMNAYGLENSIGELTQAMDNWALIANISAADVGELAQASQRAASMASAVGVSGEQLASQIATIESVTREAPEQIGNGLKTLYARFSDIAAGGEDEDGFTLGKVTSQLQAIGVQIFDQMGNIRDVGDIMEDLMVIWDDLDQTSKVAASQALAGKYQVNRFMALMDNSDMYQEYKGATGANAAGTLDIMNQEYAESLAGRSQKLETTLEGIFNNIFNTDSFYPFIDIAQKALDLVDNLTEAMGGGLPILTALVSGFTQLFSTNIARGINDMISNQQIAQTRKSNLANVQSTLADTGLDQTGVGQYIQAGADRAGVMNGEQYTIYTDQLDNYVIAATNAAKANEHLKDTYMLVAAAAGEAFNDTDLLFKDEEGINTSTLIEVLNQYKDSKALMSDLSKVDFSTATKSAQDFAKALSQLNGDLDRIKTGDRSGGEIWDIEQAEQDLYKVQEALYDLHEAGALTDQDFTDMKGTVEEAFNELADTGTIEKTAQEFDKMNITVARFSEALQRIGPETLAKGPEAIAAAISQEVAALQAEAAAAQGAEGVISNLDRQNVVNGVVTLTSSLGQLASAWMTIKNLGSILNDEDLSVGEKFLQTILNLSMVIGQITSAFDQLSKAQKTISTLFDKLNSATQMNAEALKKNADAAKKAAESSSKDNAEKTKGIVTKTADTKITEEDAKANEKLKISQDGATIATGKDVAVQTADTAAKTGATAATTGLTAAVGALKGALDLLTGPAGILITIFGMIAGAAWGAYQANIEQMKEDAQTAYDEAKSNLEQIEALKDRTSAFGEKYEAFKDSGEGGKELIEEAKSIAQAMKDAGAEEEANTIHLAALRAEARGTADDFSVLANAIENSQSSVSETVNSEAIASADKLLATENTSAKEVIEHQEKIKAAQEELNNLDPLDAGYEAEKERLEKLISTLKDAKLAEEELVDAANTKMNSTLDIGAQKIAEAEGQNMHVFQAQDAATARAGTEALTPGAMNWQSIDQYFKDISPEYAAIADEAERAAIAYEHMGTEAGKAAVEVGQLLLANENLTDNGGMQTTYDANTGQVLSQYELIGRQGIQTEMSDMGMDHEQQVQFLATLDENASESEIRTKLAELKQKMQDGQDFDVALKASLDPEQLDEMVKNRIESYEPTDEDVDADQFKSMANYIHDADESAFKEGGALEDISPEIQNNADALEELVEGILRYDDAISTLSEKEEEWRDALSDGADLEDRTDAIRELKETYSDFLDLSDDVSNSFAENTQNLDDMAAAAEGDEEAYNRLLAAASEDIAINVYGIDETSAALHDMSDFIQSDDFKNVEIGMAIDPTGEQGFYDALNRMIVEGNLTRDQVESYLNDIGCSLDPSGIEQGLNTVQQDAIATGNTVEENATYTTTVETGTAESTDTNEATSLEVKEVPGGSWSADVPTVTVQTAGMPTATSVPITGTVPPSFEVTAKPIKSIDTKQTSGSSVKTERGGAGDFHIKNGGVKKNNSGGAKNNHASSPSSSGRGGGGGGKKSCFVAGTLISTSLGFKPIEQIQKGNIVLSYNRSLGLNEYSEVLQTMVHDTIEPIYTLYIKDEQLRVTGIHRFLVTDKITCGTSQWVHAADLHVGQWVLFADGTWHVIHKIEVNIEHQTVYNFEVSGNHNYYVGRNQILAHNKGGGKGKKGGGGKAKTIEDKEKKDHQKDYYEEVSNQLEKTEKILSRIEKEEDRLIGDKARANQNKQLANLAKEIELNKEKHEIQQQELKDVDELIEKRQKEARELALDNGVNPFIPSARYDEDGVISNYEQMSEAIDNIHNELIDKYNEAARAGNENLTKEIQKTIEKFDKYGQEILKNAQRHDKLQSEIEGTINELEALEDKMEDIRIAAFKAHQEAIDDLKDLRESAAELEVLFRDFNEDGFLTDWSLDDTPMDDMIKAMYELDNIYTVTEEDANAFYQTLIDKKRQDLAATTDEDERAAIESAIQYFEEQQAGLSPDTLQNGLLGLANQDLDKLRGWIEGTNEEVNPFGNNEAALWEAYEDAYKRATDLFKDWRDTVKDLRDSIIDTYNEQEDAIEDTIDNYDRVLDHLERIGDTYALYYGDDSYDNILAIMNQQGATMQQQLNDLTAAYNYWAQKYEEAVELGDEELIKEIKEKMDNAQDAMYDKAEELAEHWVDRYEKAVDASIQRIDTKLWGGGPGQLDLEDQTTIWELQKDYMDTYRDDVEKAYEIDQLRSKYLDLLNDAQGMSLQTQNKIRAQMQDQLNLLANQTTMSEYDVKLANARLEILQKQIALEDAQRNKNKMQLRRDTQGNYRYVYTAEQGDVKQAQDELNESQFDVYELTKNQTIENNDRAINLYQDYMNKMRDIANKYKDDDIARNAAMAELSKEYGKLLEALGEDFKDTTNGMYDVLTWMIENGTQDTATAAMDMMDQLYEKSGEVKENTGNDWRDLATQITTEVLPEIENVVSEGINDISSEADSLRELLAGDDGVLTQIGSTTDTLTDSLESATDQTEKWAQAVRDLFESFSPDNTKVQQAMEQLKQMEAQMAENSSATSALSTKYKDTNAQLQSKTAEAQHYKTALDFSTGAKSIEQDSIVKLKKGTYVHYDRYGGVQQDEEGNTGWRLPDDMWVKFGKPISGVPLPYSFYATGESLKQFGGTQDPASDSRGGKAKTEARHHQVWWFDKKELQKNVLDAMDTGGYTGDWNDSTPWYKNGKAAILHQKELVLNATDTQNILAAVDIIRNMTNASIAGINNIAGFNSSNLGSAYNPVTEQRVEIQASFPNATDAEDIRQALIGLSDKAYQYAHRVI